MAYIVADRIKETTTVTGTGTVTLAGAVLGYRSFASQMSIGDTCPYVIVNANGSEWETGIATYSATNTLTRTTVHASTNANAAVVFSAGVKDVFMGPTANTILSDVTSNDGTVTINQTGTITDLSVAVAAATTNVIVQVRNTTGATLTKGTVVYINNATGQIPTVAKAIATSDATSAQTLGMISSNLANNANGYVTIIGLIDDIDTSAYTDGQQLYLSGTVAGGFTATKPYAPTHLVYVGVVEYAHGVHGKIFVKVQNGYEMDELHNVSAQSPSNGSLLIYNTTTSLWEKSPQSSLAIAPSQVTGTAVITTDSRLSDSRTPTGSAGGVLAGTYPNPSFASTTGTGSVVLSNSPTLTTATLAAGTITSSTPNTITQTWNSAGTTFNSLLVNVTDTASASTSRLASFQVNGTDKVFLDKNGTWNVSNVASNIPIIYNNYNAQILIPNSQTIRLGINGLDVNGTTRTIVIGNGCMLSWDADNNLGMRNGTNAQTFRLYNTYTDASNYERLGISWASNVCTVSTQNLGTGTLRGLTLTSAQTNIDVTGLGTVVLSKNGSALVTINNGSYRITTDAGGGISSGTDIQLGSTANRRSILWQNNLALVDDASGVLAQRSGSTAQTFRVYNTFTDASNYERLGFTWSTNTVTIAPEAGGTGTLRTMVLGDFQTKNITATAISATATVTAASGNGTTITYTAVNSFLAGQTVSVTGLTTTTGSSLNIAGMTIATATSTQFTVTNATVGTAAATQAGTATVSSAGNNLTLTAGSGVTSGAGGNIILQPGAQATTGGNGKIVLNDSGGVARGNISPSTDITYTCSAGSHIFSVSGGTAITIFNNRIVQFAQAASFGGNVTANGFAAANATWYANTSNVFDMAGSSFGDTLVALRLRGTNPEIRFGATADLGIKRNAAGIASFTDASTSGGSIAFPSASTSISANTNDLAASSSAFQRINCTVASSLTGAAPPTGGAHVDGRMIRLYNVGTANLTLSHNSTSSAAANRFYNSTGADIILATNQYVEAIYDSTNNGSGAAGWRISSIH